MPTTTAPPTAETPEPIVSILTHVITSAAKDIEERSSQRRLEIRTGQQVLEWMDIIKSTAATSIILGIQLLEACTPEQREELLAWAEHTIRLQEPSTLDPRPSTP